MSRDRDTKSLQDKLKVFFKKAGVPACGELALTPDLERELGPESAPHRRLRAARDLADRLVHLRLHEGGAERVWRAVRDLLEPAAGVAGAAGAAAAAGAEAEAEAREARHAALALLRALCEGQADRLTVMRTVLFRWLQDTHPRRPPDDEWARFRLLHALTGGGRNIACFEEAAGAFLVAWLAAAVAAAPADTALRNEFLALVTNLVKFNASSLDDHIVHAIVNCACSVLERAGDGGEAGAAGAAALALLEAVVSYSLLPSGALPAFLGALCRTANHEAYTQHSWKLMRCVVGADIGHLALQQLVCAVRGAGDAADAPDAGLVRGAVFYINMALWGPRRVPTLDVSLLAVLPAFCKAAEAGQPAVVLEVVLALAALVARAGAELDPPSWDCVLRALAAALRAERRARNALTHQRLHQLISAIEQLHHAAQLSADVSGLLDLVEEAGPERPEASAMWLVSERAAALAPPADWAAAARLVELLRREPRAAVRTHALQELTALVHRHRLAYGEELVERVGVPAVGVCAADPAPAVRAAAARAATSLARAAASDVHADLLDVLERILARPMESSSDVPLPADADVSDVAAAARGLITLLHASLPRAPAAHPARAFLVLLDHLDAHYRRPLLAHHPHVRLQIFEMLFGLRVNAFNCVGFCYDGSGAAVWGAAAARLRPVCSPHLQLEGGRAAGPRAELPAGAALLPAGRAARALVTALTKETDWKVLGLLLRALPELISERAPCVGRRAAELDLLAGTLLAMLCERPPPPAPSASEFQAAALPPLARLAPHHAKLEPTTQQRIVRCLLRRGMVLRSPQPYINALTVFALEMRETMVKMLPEVLLDLSKISDTQAIAAPMLEFLSTLTRLPHVFASFVEDQYMSVFAILLPYTNPSRYNHYVVSLAHRVVGGWFLQCRPHYRRNFVRFILHGLHNYIILPFEERLSRTGAVAPGTVEGVGVGAGGASNEDSSNRQRSSSLGSRAPPRAPLGRALPPSAPTPAHASAAFHVELTETCVDLLARYAFTPCSVKPHRSDVAELMFAGGQSMTWLVGHKLVTITTSGCLQNSIKQGLCERCAALCRQQAGAGCAASPAPAAAAVAPAAPAAPAADEPANEEAAPADVEPSTPDEGDPLLALTARLERLEAEEAGGAGGEWRAAALAAGGRCPCWCARWAQVHVRAPTGDTAWVARLQNPPHAAPLDPLEDVAALLQPRRATASPSPAAVAPAPEPGSPAAATPAPDDRRQPVPAPPRLSTQPINIPGSPQRQSSSSTTDDDDLLLAPSSKARHPVRRSNSSPEMSSWKLREPPPDLIVLEPAPAPAAAPAPAPAPGGKKAGKKGDMRVSCEAIPEEMSGTSPHAPAAAPPGAPSAHAHHAHHPHLMTFNSDPGARSDAEDGAPPADRHQLQKTASDSTVSTEGTRGGGGAGGAATRDDLPPLARSKRSNTISVMSPTRRHRVVRSESSGGAARGAAGGGGGGGAAGGGGALSPAFVFLQLYHNMSTYPLTPPAPGAAPSLLHPLAERPLRLTGAQHERTIKNLDLVPPLETYKVGVLYVGEGQQDDEVAILSNEYGSVRYADFLSGLGSLVSLDGGEERPELFLNLEQGGADGRYTYVWADAVTQLHFHVATAMPRHKHDPHCNEKRKYIGNDYVSIVYNDSGHDFNIHTIKGQLNFCIVVVEPLAGGLSRVLVKTKDERVRTKFLPHVEPHTLSDASAALLARQTALHCALASQISQSLTLGGAPYASNALERLRLIKRLRQRAEAERLNAARAPAPYAAATPHHLTARVAIDDFNDYT